MKKSTLHLIMEGAADAAAEHGHNLVENTMVGHESLEDAVSRGAQIEKIIESSDFSEEEAGAFRQYCENSCEDYLLESVSSQDIKPLAGFQLTLLRELFARQIGKKLCTHEVMPTPSEKYATFETILEDAAGVQHKLADITTSTAINEGWSSFPLLTATAANLTPNLYGAAYLNTTAVQVPNRRLDVKTRITAVRLVCLDNGGANPENVDVVVNITAGEDGGFVAKVEAAHTDGTITTDRVFGYIDFVTGDVQFGSTGGAAVVSRYTINARLSNSYAEVNDMIMTLEYKKMSIDVDDGKLIQMAIPLNYLQDTKAWFNIDGMTKAVEKMSTSINVLADREILSTVATAVTAIPAGVRSRTWARTLPAATTRVDHNASLIYEINMACAASDDATQFTTITEYNIASNPMDAAQVTTPGLVNQGLDNATVTSGTIGYKVAPMVSANGTINILSTKQQAVNVMAVVPKSGIMEERVIGKYTYSNILMLNSEVRNRRAQQVKNVATRERSTVEVHEDSALTKITLT